MKKLAVLALAISCSTAVMAEDKSVAVRAEGGLLGYGGALTYQVTPTVGLTLGYNGGQYTYSHKIDSDEYDFKFKNDHTYLNAEYRPFASWQYFALGVARLNPDYAGYRHFTTDNNFEIEGYVFTATGDVQLKAKVDYDSDFVPYLGIGFQGHVHPNVSLFSELGVYYTGKPSFDIETDGLNNVQVNVNGEPIDPKQAALQYNDAVAEAKKQFEEDFKLQWLPNVKVGVAFHF